MASETWEKGTPLEARVQRLFMCQGAYAERGLLVRAAKGDSKLVTDIDVVAHDYSINFHHTRIYAECKGGKHRSPLDRAVWIRGIKEAISADFSYLVLERCDPSTIQFAKSLGVEILQLPSLSTLESALKIGKNFWPGRSNLQAYQKFDYVCKQILDRKTRGGLSEWLYHASEIWRDASALAFSYGRLNTLLGVLEDSAKLHVEANSADEDFVVNYAVAALLVRLCQYVLYCAADTLAMGHTARVAYIAERFTVGNFDLEQSRSLISSAANMVRAQLRAQGQEPPEGWKVDRLLAAPPYSRAFTEVVERCISEGDKLRLLPLGMELRLFGFGGDERDSGRLTSRIRPCLDLTGLIVAFARQSLNVPESFVGGPFHYVTGMGVKPLQPKVAYDTEESVIEVNIKVEKDEQPTLFKTELPSTDSQDQEKLDTSQSTPNT